MASASLKEDNWKGSGEDSNNKGECGSVSLEGGLEFFGSVRNEKHGKYHVIGKIPVQDSECQTNVSGNVWHQEYYTDKCVIRHTETLKSVMNHLGKLGHSIQDLECQTVSTGQILTIGKMKLCLNVGSQADLKGKYTTESLCTRSPMLFTTTDDLPTVNLCNVESISHVIPSHVMEPRIEVSTGINQALNLESKVNSNVVNPKSKFTSVQHDKATEVQPVLLLNAGVEPNNKWVMLDQITQCDVFRPPLIDMGVQVVAEHLGLMLGVHQSSQSDIKSFADTCTQADVFVWNHTKPTASISTQTDEAVPKGSLIVDLTHTYVQVNTKDFGPYIEKATQTN